MNRSITNKINYLLDNWIPPRIRDSKILMGIALRIALGSKYKYYMSFKENVVKMSEKEIKYYYELLADTFIDRKTDLNDRCIKFILSNIVGDSILDAAAGRGYLAGLLYQKLAGGIHAVDIILPNKKQKGIQYHQASLTQLPFNDNCFDTVICTHALEHIKDLQSALKELRRVCKKRLIIVVPRQREYQYTFDLHINFFPYEYTFRKFIDNEKARILEIGHDWVCIEDFYNI